MKYIAGAMEDYSMKETYNCWQLKGQIDEFNISREKRVFKSHIFVFDESISAQGNSEKEIGAAM